MQVIRQANLLPSAAVLARITCCERNQLDRPERSRIIAELSAKEDKLLRLTMPMFGYLDLIMDLQVIFLQR